jgi:uncharacterized damage-inducible protein DinB
MAVRGDDVVRVVLLDALERAYERASWHGPNLKGSIRGLKALEAAWRPAKGRHSIAEIVLHAAYWKYAVRRALKGEPRGGFSVAGSNWFALPEPFDEAVWARWREILDREHALLREAVKVLPFERLEERVGSRKFTHRELIQGITAHDVYHAGQIQSLKRLRNRGEGPAR